MDNKEKNEELRPTKMRGVVFPKAKYGVIAAIIIIVVVNLIYYKDFFIINLNFKLKTKNLCVELLAFILKNKKV